MLSPKLTKYLAAGTAAVAVAVSGFAIGNASSGNGTSGTATPAQATAPRQGSAPDHTAQSGQLPPGWQPGSGTIITGATADKVEALAVANYPGTVNRVLKLSDGSYAAHMFATSGPHHVFVSKDFKITGTA